MDTCSWKLTGEANSTTPHVDVLWLTVKIIKHTLLDTTPQKLIGVVMTLTLTMCMSPCSLKLIGEHITQGLWGEPQHRTPYIPRIGPQTDSLATGQSFLAMVIQLQWFVVLGRLVTHTQVTTLSKLMVASS